MKANTSITFLVYFSALFLLQSQTSEAYRDPCTIPCDDFKEAEFIAIGPVTVKSRKFPPRKCFTLPVPQTKNKTILAVPPKVQPNGLPWIVIVGECVSKKIRTKFLSSHELVKKMVAQDAKDHELLLEFTENVKISYSELKKGEFVTLTFLSKAEVHYPQGNPPDFPLENFMRENSFDEWDGGQRFTVSGCERLCKFGNWITGVFVLAIIPHYLLHPS